MREIIQIKCPSCGNVIGSEHIHGSIIYCERCNKNYVFVDSGMLSPVFYKIYPHSEKAVDINKQFLDYFANINVIDIFSYLVVKESVRRYYVPMREVRVGNRHFFVVLNNTDCGFLEAVCNNGEIEAADIRKGLHEARVANLTIADYKHIYEQKKEDRVEFLPIDVEIKKVDALYGINSNEITVVKYMPVSVLDTNVGTVIAVGDDEVFTVVNSQEIIKDAKSFSEEKAKNKLPIKEFFTTICGIAVVTLIAYAIYEFFTFGWTFDFESFIKLILSLITGGFIVAWCVFLGGLYFIAAVIFLLPLILLVILCVRLIKDRKETKKVDMKNGRKIFNLE